MRGVKLTKLQAEMLHDRLTLPECIIEALPEEYPNVSEAKMGELISRLELRVDRIRERGGGTLSTGCFASKLEREILCDAVEGATYLHRIEDAYNDGDMSPAQLGGFRRAARGLSEKLNRVGINNSGMPAA